jgi:hypothetical protein
VWSPRDAIARRWLFGHMLVTGVSCGLQFLWATDPSLRIVTVVDGFGLSLIFAACYFVFLFTPFGMLVVFITAQKRKERWFSYLVVDTFVWYLQYVSIGLEFQ